MRHRGSGQDAIRDGNQGVCRNLACLDAAIDSLAVPVDNESGQTGRAGVAYGGQDLEQRATRFIGRAGRMKSPILRAT
jgi:hypothetical protein